MSETDSFHSSDGASKNAEEPLEKLAHRSRLSAAQGLARILNDKN